MKHFNRAIILLLLFIGCQEEKIESVYPLVQTGDVTNIQPSGATFYGKVINMGSQEIVDHGFVWDANPSPTVEQSYVKSLGATISNNPYVAEITSAFVEGTTYYVRAFVRDKNSTVYGREVSFVSLGSNAPAITDFNPKTATWGDTIIVTGENFSLKEGENKVKFGNFSSTIIQGSDSVITTIVPVTLDTTAINIAVSFLGHTALSEEKFNLTPPEIVDFNPKEGIYKTQVEIKGNYFFKQNLDTEVKFGTLSAELTNINDSVIIVEVPSGLPAGEVSLSVKVATQKVFSNDNFTVNSPHINSFNPKSGTFRDVITISGQHFHPVLSYNNVTLGNSVATIIEGSTTELKVAVPDNYFSEDGKSKISVTVDGLTDTSEDDFELLLHSITDFTPTAGSRGDEITITGHYFHPDKAYNKVFIGEVEANITACTPTSLSISPSNGVIHGDQPIKITIAGREVVASGSFMIHEPWQRKNDFPGGSRFGSFTFTIGNKVYVGGGRSGSSYIGGGTSGPYANQNDFWEYNPATDTWIQKADLPEGIYSSASFATTSKGYILYGKNLWQYNPVLDVWNEVADFPGSIAEGQSAFSIGDKGYVGTGYVNVNHDYAYYLSEFWEYNEITNAWTQKTDYSYKMAYGVSFSIGNKGYIAMGRCFYGDGQNEIWEYDPATNQWTKKSELIEGYRYARRGAVAFTINGKGYILTGTDGMYHNSIYEYDPVSNNVTRLIDMPTSGRGYAVGFSINNKGFIGGGTVLEKSKFVRRSDFWEFDPARLKP